EVGSGDAGAARRVEDWIRQLGYQPRAEAAGGETGSALGLALRAGLALFLGMGVMTLSWALYAQQWSSAWGWLGGRGAGPAAARASALSPSGLNLLNGANAAAAGLAVFVCGWPIVRAGVRGLVRWLPNADSLFTLSTLGAYGLSCLAWREGQAAYFDLAAMLMALLLAGRWIQAKARQRAQRERDRWRYASAPAWRACREAAAPGGAVGWRPGERVAAEALAAGDGLALRSGETVPTDARLAAGWLDLDESSLTGESRAVRRNAGEYLLGGAQILAAAPEGAYATVLRPAAASLRGQMAARVEGALRARARGQAVAGLDRVAQAFVPAVLGLVAAAYAANLWAGVGQHAAIWRAITLLIFACPCTLGLAVPLLEDRAITQAAAAGILVQDLEALPRLSRCRTVVLDKTGTVTEGQMAVAAFVHTTAAGVREQDLLAAAAALETPPLEAGQGTGGDHPIAAAIRAFTLARHVAPAAIPAETVPGQGQRGVWQGREWRIGRAGFAVVAGLPPELEAEAARMRGEGDTVVALSRGGQAMALFGLRDPLRPGAMSTIGHWLRRGPVWLVSGDEQAAVEAAARRLKIGRWRAADPPEDKARFVAALTAQGERVAMIGDGYNDAAALAAAEVGLALARGADLPCRAAAITLLRGGFPVWERVFALSRELRRRRRVALSWACGYNAVGLPLAALGLVGPIGAAAAMLISSFSSLAYALRPFRALRSEPR
ncbi:MAG: heavy metal translocating P-type ATPase, partial [Terriglobales bacterium]